MNGKWRYGVISLVGGVLALAVAGGAWLLAHRDSAPAASIDSAVARYRERAAAGETLMPAGVYTYRTTGFERISALGGARHRYPEATTITVTAAPCGVDLRWDGLKTRTTTWRICTGGEGGVLAHLDDWEEIHTFYGQRDVSSWRCNPSPWLTGDEAVGTTTSYLCDGGNTTIDGSVVIVGEGILAVGAAPVDVLHVRVRAEEAGASRGEIVEERWVERETGLPVRMTVTVTTRNDSPIGNVDFEEQFDLRLLSLEPRR